MPASTPAGCRRRWRSPRITSPAISSWSRSAPSSRTRPSPSAIPGATSTGARSRSTTAPTIRWRSIYAENIAAGPNTVTVGVVDGSGLDPAGHSRICRHRPVQCSGRAPRPRRGRARHRAAGPRPRRPRAISCSASSRRRAGRTFTAGSGYDDPRSGVRRAVHEPDGARPDSGDGGRRRPRPPR